MSVHGFDPEFEPRRRPRQPRSIYRMAVVALAVCSNALLGLALIGLLQPVSVLDYIKIALIVMAGAIVMITVNNLALERGTRLYVVGYSGVALAMLAAVVFVGSGLASATFAGLVREDVDQLALQAHGQALSDAIARSAGNASGTAQAAPIVRSIAGDLAAKAECERVSSCVSGRRGGGQGPVARYLAMLAMRGEAVAAEFDAAVQAASANAGRTSGLVSEYRTVAAGPLPLAEKRLALQTLDARIRESFFGQGVSASASLAPAYLAELQAPVTIAGQPEASRAVAALLKGHADSLRSAMAQAVRSDRALPSFPQPAGIADTLASAPRFWPVLVLAVVIDVVLPLLLWVGTAATRHWNTQGTARPAPRPLSEDERETTQILKTDKSQRFTYPADRDGSSYRNGSWRDGDAY